MWWRNPILHHVETALIASSKGTELQQTMNSLKPMCRKFQKWRHISFQLNWQMDQQLNCKIKKKKDLDIRIVRLFIYIRYTTLHYCFWLIDSYRQFSKDFQKINFFSILKRQGQTLGEWIELIWLFFQIIIYWNLPLNTMPFLKKKSYLPNSIPAEAILTEKQNRTGN